MSHQKKISSLTECFSLLLVIATLGGVLAGCSDVKWKVGGALEIPPSRDIVTKNQNNVFYYKYDVVYEHPKGSNALKLSNVCDNASLLIDSELKIFGSTVFGCDFVSGRSEVAVPVFAFGCRVNKNGRTSDEMKYKLESSISPFVIYGNAYNCSMHTAIGNVYSESVNATSVVALSGELLQVVGDNSLTAGALSSAYQMAETPINGLVARLRNASISDGSELDPVEVKNGNEFIPKYYVRMSLKSSERETPYDIGSLRFTLKKRLSLIAEHYIEIGGVRYPDFSREPVIPALKANDTTASLKAFVESQSKILAITSNPEEYNRQLDESRKLLEKFSLNEYDQAFCMYVIAKDNPKFEEHRFCRGSVMNAYANVLSKCGITYPGDRCINSSLSSSESNVESVMNSFLNQLFIERSDTTADLVEVLAGLVYYSDDGPSASICSPAWDVAQRLQKYKGCYGAYRIVPVSQEFSSNAIFLQKSASSTRYYTVHVAVESNNKVSGVKFRSATTAELESARRRDRAPGWLTDASQCPTPTTVAVSQPVP